MDVINSGRDVPIAIIDSPIKESGIFNSVETFIAEFTAKSTPNSVNAMEKSKMGRPYIKGFLKE